MPHFKKGSVIQMTNDDVVIIDTLIGEGNMAEVYRAISKNTRRVVALKYMFGDFSTNNALYYKKCKLMAGHPAPHPDIVWFNHNSISQFDEKNQVFAFTMPLLEGYHSFVNAIRRSDLLTFEQRMDACKQIADIFRTLHNAGFVYGDISANNVMYKLDANGKIHVKLIDCDNVVIPGFSLGLSGTGLYRAPEIICGGSPTIQSDCHALAVLMFRLLFKVHPLDGAAAHQVQFTPENVIKLFGKDPVFIFNEQPLSVSPNLLRRWESLPYPIQLIFKMMFSKNRLKGTLDRPTAEQIWKALELS